MFAGHLAAFPSLCAVMVAVCLANVSAVGLLGTSFSTLPPSRYLRAHAALHGSLDTRAVADHAGVCQGLCACAGRFRPDSVLALRGGAPKKAAGKRTNAGSKVAQTAAALAASTAVTTPLSAATTAASTAGDDADDPRNDELAGTMPYYPPGSLPDWAHDIVEWRNMTMVEKVAAVEKKQAETGFDPEQYYAHGYTTSSSSQTPDSDNELNDQKSEPASSSRDSEDFFSSVSGVFEGPDSLDEAHAPRGSPPILPPGQVCT
jgi:hypothetical protein